MRICRTKALKQKQNEKGIKTSQKYRFVDVPQTLLATDDSYAATESMNSVVVLTDVKSVFVLLV